MNKHLIKTLMLTAGVAGVSAVAGLADAASNRRAASLIQDPVVMRLSKDEFRIAFGINAERCAVSGCNGVIRYRVDWATEDGTPRSEIKHVSYTIVANSSRAMTVDRQYFDTAEGAHTTSVLKVTVDMITCVDGADQAAAQTASTATPL